MPPQLFYLLTLSFWRHIYILSRCLWTLTINILPLKSSVELEFTESLANPLAKGKALFYLTTKKGSWNKWRSGERSFMPNTIFTRVDHLSFPSLCSGLSRVPTSCFSKAHLHIFCGVVVGRCISPGCLSPFMSVVYPTHHFPVGFSI